MVSYIYVKLILKLWDSANFFFDIKAWSYWFFCLRMGVQPEIETWKLFPDGKEKPKTLVINLLDYHLFIWQNLYLYIFLPFAIAKTSPWDLVILFH